MTNDARPILLVEDNPMDVDLTLRAFVRRKVANPVQIARDGEETFGFIQRWDAGEQIPVVGLTTSSEDHDVEVAHTLGANSYIVKPVDFLKFVDVATKIDLYWTLLNTPAIYNEHSLRGR
jgi:PleD family two-component response regulator